MFEIPTNTALFALLPGSGVLAAVLTQFATFLFTRRSNERKARYLALRSTLAIEDFGEACLVLVYENDAGQDDEPGGKQHVSLPKIDPFPEDDDGWRALPSELSHRLLTFPAKIHSKQRVSTSTGITRTPTTRLRSAVTPQSSLAVMPIYLVGISAGR